MDRPRLSPTCPAATIVEGVLGAPSILCGVLARDRMVDDSDVKEDESWSVFSLQEDTSTVLGHCCARYESCGIWMADKDRIRERRNTLEAV